MAAGEIPPCRPGVRVNIVVNGQSREVADGLLLTDLLSEMHLPSEQRGLAVARNGEVVLRMNWADTTLEEGDRVEVLRAVQGG